MAPGQALLAAKQLPRQVCSWLTIKPDASMAIGLEVIVLGSSTGSPSMNSCNLSVDLVNAKWCHWLSAMAPSYAMVLGLIPAINI